MKIRFDFVLFDLAEAMGPVKGFYRVVYSLMDDYVAKSQDEFRQTLANDYEDAEDELRRQLDNMVEDRYPLELQRPFLYALLIGLYGAAERALAKLLAYKSPGSVSGSLQSVPKVYQFGHDGTIATRYHSVCKRLRAATETVPDDFRFPDRDAQMLSDLHYFRNCVAHVGGEIRDFSKRAELEIAISHTNGGMCDDYNYLTPRLEYIKELTEQTLRAVGDRYRAWGHEPRKNFFALNEED